MNSIKQTEDMKALLRVVEDNGDVYTMSMERLRDTYGAGRLGIHVRHGISSDLAKLGLGHWPAELPDSQYKCVRLYRKGTPAGDLIEAVLLDVARAHDDQIRRADDQIRQATEGDDAAIVRKIRELVCA